jgi:hypothetical protein
MSNKIISRASVLLLLLLNGILGSERFPRFPSELSITQNQNPTYQQFISGCSEFYSPSLCHQAEISRTERNQNEPGTQYNFTELGYQITPLPLLIRREIKTYFNDHLHFNQIENLEQMPSPSATQFQINHWAKKTHLLPLSDSFISTIVVEYLQDFIEKWIQSPIALSQNPIWRIHREGSVVAPHLEMVPNVITMIYQIDFDDEEEEMDEEEDRWPLQIIDHHGQEHFLTLSRGDMMIYEVSPLLLPPHLIHRPDLFLVS